MSTPVVFASMFLIVELMRQTTQGTITGIDIYRTADGQIEEAWSNWDTLRLLQQIGIIPSMQ